jgi:hypothetical protein
VVAQVAAGPARQYRDRVAGSRERGVGGEVGERGARGADLGEARAHHLPDHRRDRDLDDVERVEPGLVLVAGVAHARLPAQERAHAAGRSCGRRRDVAAGVEQQRVLLDVARVLASGVGGGGERLGEPRREGRLDRREPGAGVRRRPGRRARARLRHAQPPARTTS